MKVKVEIEIPDNVLATGASDVDHRVALEEYLGEKVQHIYSMEPNLPKSWQVWSRIDGNWHVLDVEGDEYGDLNSTEAVRDHKLYVETIRENVNCDQRVATNVWYNTPYDDTVIRHSGMKHIDPMVMQVVTPYSNLASVDIAAYLMRLNSEEVENLASRGFQMNASDFGNAITTMESIAQSFVLESILDNGEYVNEDGDFIFMACHDRWNSSEWVNVIPGSASVDAGELGAWLRTYRSEISFPDPSVRP